jgi:voltage-gated potassium channel
MKIRTISSIVIIFLVIIDVFLITWSSFSNVGVLLTQGIIYFDLAVCFILFCDFMLRLHETEDKKAFFKNKWTWIDIIAMIPIEFAPFRFIRLIRVLILLNKGSKLLKEFIEETHLDWSFGILLMTIIGGTILFYIVEVGINTNVHNLGDAFWYVLPTMATDGGNIYPATVSGRIISMIVMIIGILFLGMFTAQIASWLTEKSGKKCEQNEIQELKGEMQELQSEIIELKEIIRKNK